MQAFATFKSQAAKRYKDALCAHFEPQVSRSGEGDAVCIRFAFGECELDQKDGTLELTAHAEDSVRLARVTEVMSGYLERFAFRENPRLNWRTVAASRSDDAPANPGPRA
ncbi:MAG: DUF2218 domain-containing protein [Pseudomonadota bacterium]